MGGRGCGGLGTLFKEFYFVQKIRKFSTIGFRWGEGGGAGGSLDTRLSTRYCKAFILEEG